MAFRRVEKRKRTLEPFKDFPAFLVRGLAGCRQKGIPAALFCGLVSCRPSGIWCATLQEVCFLLFVLTYLGDHAPRSPLWNLYAHSRYNM